MPWEVRSMKSEKQKFVLLYQTGQFTKSDLCAQFGISRPTGDAILKRYEEEGWDALKERSRRHGNHPLTTPKEVEDAIVRERKKHTHWGARKIIVLLRKDPTIHDRLIPSETTVNNIMKKHGLTMIRRKAPRHIEDQHPVYDPKEPNEIWSADFKGKFRLGNREYCHPLTIADSYTRYLIAITGVETPNTESSKPIFDKAFCEYGLPEFMHTDNGAPFGNSMSLRRMTQLSVWLMDLGITPVYSDPGCPQQNGRHERMHRDLKAEATGPPATTLAAQQKRFDIFRKEYNMMRPHEALGMKTPADVYKRSARVYTRNVREWDYDKALQTKLVTVNGAVRWNSERFVMITTALAGRYVGFKDEGNGVWSIWYRHVLLGYFSERTNTVYEADTFSF